MMRKAGLSNPIIEAGWMVVGDDDHDDIDDDPGGGEGGDVAI